MPDSATLLDLDSTPAIESQCRRAMLAFGLAQLNRRTEKVPFEEHKEWKKHRFYDGQFSAANIPIVWPSNTVPSASSQPETLKSLVWARRLTAGIWSGFTVAIYRNYISWNLGKELSFSTEDEPEMKLCATLMAKGLWHLGHDIAPLEAQFGRLSPFTNALNESCR